MVRDGDRQEETNEEELDRQLLEGAIFGYGTFDGCLKVLRRRDFDAEPPEDDRRDKGGFQFLAGEARPGTGIVPVEDGREIGPSGALGLFLFEKDDPCDIWFLAAGHVVTGCQWILRPDIYRSMNGVTSCVLRRKLGVVRCVNRLTPPKNGKYNWNTFDAGLVRLDRIDWKQETTCYGAVGAPRKAVAGPVRKCGPEEPFSTWGKVRGTDWKIRVVCKERCVENDVVVDRESVYLFKNQILVSCGQEYLQPFAMPGDSGSLVVNTDGYPVGMLMAGSVRHDFFFLNPIHRLKRFWEKDGKLKQASVAKVSRQADRHPGHRGRRGAGARTGVGRAT